MLIFPIACIVAKNGMGLFEESVYTFSLILGTFSLCDFSESYPKAQLYIKSCASKNLSYYLKKANKSTHPQHFRSENQYSIAFIQD